MSSDILAVASDFSTLVMGRLASEGLSFEAAGEDTTTLRTLAVCITVDR